MIEIFNSFLIQEVRGFGLTRGGGNVSIQIKEGEGRGFGLTRVGGGMLVFR